MSDNARWVLPFGSAKGDGYDVAITPTTEDWQHTGLYAVTLAPGESREIEGGEFEYLVVPLSGSATVMTPSGEIWLTGRESVFSGPTDVAYLPRGAQFRVTSAQGARVALPFARAAKREVPPPARHLRADEVQVELRGAGQASREVRNFGTPQVLEADSIIACEVLTPAGNWSSYPPHKHDEEREGVETEQEEIYYFELRPEAGGPTPEAASAALGAELGGSSGGGAPRALGYQRVYGTAERPIDVLTEVRSGDVVLVPHGWHGPAMAPPGYDLYYLNVMAGPGATRAWLICDDPAHAWVRDTWASQPVDPRLPLGGGRA
jgi:5-deoxy-glucuronate isomerase